MNYHALATVQLGSENDYYKAGDLPEIVHADDSALDVLFDFKHTKALTIGYEKPIFEARQEMTFCGILVLLVVDELGQAVGLISSEDILGTKPVKISQEKDMQRADIKVSMIMTPCEKLTAISIQDVESAKVGHILETLIENKCHYALAVDVDADTDKKIVRGVFSLTHISRQLDIDPATQARYATSLAKLKQMFD